LDLRGGVHFLMQVDTRQALAKRLETATADVRSLLRERNVRHAGIQQSGDTLTIRFRDEETRERARNLLRDNQPDLQLTPQGSGSDLALDATLTEAARQAFIDSSLQQNITTLNNRINELGVAEPVI